VAEELGQWVTKSEPSTISASELTERLNAAATGCGKSGRRGRPSAQGRRRRREPQLVVDIQRGNNRASCLRALSWNHGLLDVWSSRIPSIG
jgi:hypothetical protein